MNLLILSQPNAAAATVAGVIAQAASEEPELVLALPTGRTPLPVYDELTRLRGRGELDLSRARAFNLDELRLPSEHPASFQSYMRRHAWERIGLDPGRCDIPDGEADPVSECARYDSAVVAAGGLDLAFLGVGEDGHVAYNLPGVPHPSTHVVELPTSVADSVGAPSQWRPLEAVTMGLETIASARRLVMLAVGESKVSAVRALLQGPQSPDWPCSLLRNHQRFDVVLDLAAAGGDWSSAERIMPRG